MKTYRVYFSDGNQKLYQARYIQDVVEYVNNISDYFLGGARIIRIEEVEA